MGEGLGTAGAAVGAWGSARRPCDSSVVALERLLSVLPLLKGRSFLFLS